jgi:sporulation protein YqfC
MKKRWVRLRKWFADVSEIPEDLITDVPRITITGRSHLSVENHLGIISFSEKELILSTHLGELQVLGDSFVLETIMDEEIDLAGSISEIRFRKA